MCIDHDVHPFLGSRVFDTTDWDEATDGFFVDKELASRILNFLTVEFRSLATAISLMSERRLEIDSLIQHLKTFAPSLSRGNLFFWFKGGVLMVLVQADSVSVFVAVFVILFWLKIVYLRLFTMLTEVFFTKEMENM